MATCSLTSAGSSLGRPNLLVRAVIIACWRMLGIGSSPADFALSISVTSLTMDDYSPDLTETDSDMKFGTSATTEQGMATSPKPPDHRPSTTFRN